MKWIAVVILGCMLLFGCAGDDRSECFQSVQNTFPGGKVVVLGRDGYKFVVKDKDGSVWYVETMNSSDTNITKKIQLF